MVIRSKAAPPGISAAAPAAAALAALVLAVVLAGCAPGTPTPAEPGASASAPESENPVPTVPPPPAVAAIPTDCRDIVDPATYAATFGEGPLNDPQAIDPSEAGELTPTPAPVGATYREIIASATELRCLWRQWDADLTYLQVEIGTVPTNVGLARLDQLSAEGYTCEDTLDGRRCQQISTIEGYDVDEGDTQFLRDDVYIQVGQANFTTNGLLAAIVDRVWS